MRTSDVIKSIKVLAVWLAVLNKDVFKKSDTLLTEQQKIIQTSDFKTKFVKFATEEVLRRSASKEVTTVVTNKAKFESELYPKANDFFTEKFGIRKKEIEELHKVDQTKL